MMRRSFFIFLLIFLACFLVFPHVCFGAITLEEIKSYLELPERETKLLLQTLIDKLTSRWINLEAWGYSKPENKAVLIIVREAVRIDVLNYAIIQLPKEIGKSLIKAIYKTALFVYSPDKMSFLLEEFEKISVEKAKKVAMEWLLQKEVRVATGNLPVSYNSYKGHRQDVTFPYILVYRPLDVNHGETGISIYSSRKIEAPGSRGSIGILLGTPCDFRGELDPFILHIKGKIEKISGGGVIWTEEPEIEIEFPEYVPDFDFSEPSVFEKIKRDLEEKALALKKAEEIAKNIFGKIGKFVGETAKDMGKGLKNAAEKVISAIKNAVSRFNPFGAQVAGPSLPPASEDKKLLQEKEEEIQHLKVEIEELKEKVESKEVSPSEEENLKELAKKLDKIAAEMDKMGKRIAALRKAQAKVEREQKEQEEQEEQEEAQEDLSQSLPKILISEVCVGLDKASNEFIEIYNPNNSSISLSDGNFNLKLVSSSNKISKKQISWSKNVIPSKEYFLLVGGKLKIDGQILSPDATFSSRLTGTGGVILTDGEDNILDKTAWGSPEKLPPSAGMETKGVILSAGLKTGQSIERRKSGSALKDSDNNSQDFVLSDNPSPTNSSGQTKIYHKPTTSEDSSSESDGTGGGGGEGTSPPSYPKILISEIQISPTEERFIELYNSNDSEVDLTNWYLQRKTANAISWASFVSSTKFEGKIIPAKTHFLIARFSQSADIFIEDLTLTKNNTLALKNPNGEIVDEVNWGEIPVGLSYGRSWNEIKQEYSNNFEIQIPTPKAKNQKDTTSPQVEITSSPPLLTNQTQAIFTFQANEENCSFQCQLDSRDWGSCESPAEYEELSNGEHTFSVKAIDLFSNVSLPAGYTWTIDTTIESASLSLIDVDSNSQTYTNSQEVRVEINNDEGAVAWLLSETQVEQPTADDPAWQSERPTHFTLSDEDGPKTVYLWTKDKAGNISPLGNSASIVLDRTAPSFSLSSSLNELTITLTWQADDGEGSGVLNYDIQYKIEQGQWQDLLLQTEQTQTSFQVEAGKTYYFRGRAKDKTGNQGDWSSEVSEDTLFPQSTQEIVINEIAWMGTKASDWDEWLELYNTDEDIDLDGWKLIIGEREINLEGDILANDFYLLERAEKATDVSANLVYGGERMSNNGLKLELRDVTGNLIDSVDCSAGWFAGKNEKDDKDEWVRISMERIDPESPGDNLENWQHNNQIIINGLDAGNNPILGTPRAPNSPSQGPITLPQHINRDLTLTKDFSPYIIQGTVSVSAGKTLIIEPGAVVKFEPGKESQISSYGGTLQALGEENQPIIFTSLLDDLTDLDFDFKDLEKDTNGDGSETFPSPGNWRRINLVNGSKAELAHTIIRYGGYCGSLHSYQVIGINKSSITLRNSIVEKNCGGGIEFLEDDPDFPSLIEKTKFLNNKWVSSEPTNIHIGKGAPTIRNCYFEGNYWAIYARGSTSPIIENNNFVGNYMPILLNSGSAPVVQQNSGENNNVNGIVISASGTAYPEGTNTIIWENNEGLPFVIDSFFRVEPGLTLEIEPGTVIKFGHEYGQNFQLYQDSFLKIEGILLAKGIENEPIVFTSLRDDEHGGDTDNNGKKTLGPCGAWKNIQIEPSATVDLAWVEIRYGGFENSHPLTIKKEAKVTQNDVTITDSPPFVEVGEDKEVSVGENVSFEATVASFSDSGIFTALWDFGDGSPEERKENISTDSLSTIHTYSSDLEPGDYLVTLRITDDNGVTEDSLKVTVKE